MREIDEVELSKARLMYRLENTYCRLRPSVLAKGGVGVFAIRDIPAGTVLFSDSPESLWHSLSQADEDSLHPAVVQMLKDFFHYEEGSGERRELPAYGLGNLSLGFYINHSLTPNAEVVPDEVDEGEEDEDDDDVDYSDIPFQQCLFRTIRLVKAGEEVCYNYHTISDAYKGIDDKAPRKKK